MLRGDEKVLAIVDKSNDPEKIAIAERVHDEYDRLMRLTGLYTSDDMQIANEGQAPGSLEARATAG